MSETDTRRTSPLKVLQRVRSVEALVITRPTLHDGAPVPIGTIGEVQTVRPAHPSAGILVDVRFTFYDAGGVLIDGVAEAAHRSALETVLGKPRMTGEAKPGSDTPPKRRGSFPYRTSITEHERSMIGTTCPKCGKGLLREKHGKRGPFVGCDQYHVSGCTYTVRETGQGNGSSNGNEPQDEQQDAVPLGDDEQDEPTPGSLDAIIASIARRAAAGAVNEAKVREIIGTELDRWSQQYKPGDREIVVTVKDAAPVKVNGKAHAKLADVVQAIAACDPTGEETGIISYPNIMLVGPAGSGKTTLAQQVAEALGLEWDGISCHPETPASKIEGRMLVKIMSGEEVYIPTGFVRLVEHGGVWINDEGDNMNGGLAIVYNAVLANGWMTLPDGRRINRHRTFVFIHCANTYGTGADPVYVREQQDAAFLDRFVGMKFFIDYDLELEQTLCPEVKIREAVYAIRRKVAELPIRGAVVGTRSLLAARRIVTREGKSMDEALRRITDGWSLHNRKSAGVPC